MNGQLIQMENVVLVHPSKGNREAEAADPFTTSYTPSDPTSIDNTPFPSGEGWGEASKILRDGQILILRGEKEYTLTGQEVKWKKVSHLRFIHTGGSMSRPIACFSNKYT